MSHVTINDVAREAGVSLMTVSRVVNNKEDVSKSTRQRVLEVIDELEYRPSSIAARFSDSAHLHPRRCGTRYR